MDEKFRSPISNKAVPRSTEVQQELPNPESVAKTVVASIIRYQTTATIRLSEVQKEELVKRSVLFVLGGGSTGRKWNSERRQRFVRALIPKLLAAGLKYPNIPELDSLLK
jgi:hypothetical protein